MQDHLAARHFRYCQSNTHNLRFTSQEIKYDFQLRRHGEQQVHGPIRVSISVSMRPRTSSGAFLFPDQDNPPCIALKHRRIF